MKRIVILFLCASLLLAGCAAAEAAPEDAQAAGGVFAKSPAATLARSAAGAAPTTIASDQTGEPGPAPTRTPFAAHTATPRATPSPAFDPDSWGDLPVIPTLSPRAREILADGLARGNNPRAFAKIGDCESQAAWFLENFDLDPQYYSLGSYAGELEPVIDYYAGSFKRTSLAAKPGYTAASLLVPLMADRAQCEKDESPLDCEYRTHNPAVAFILVGTNDASNPKTFEGHLRRVLDATIARGILPVLGTKADNVEGDHRINATIARLAHEYQIPLWNYWAAVQPLPAQGLQEDGVHLTFAAPHFDNPEAMKRAWPVRNLNALQVLSVVLAATE